MRAAMAGPANRIKAMRAQLRDLYEKLGWEWDLSDSEDEDDGQDKPYWYRRKIAVNGFLPFNQQDFLFAEKSFHSRRRKKLTTFKSSEETQQIVERMKAKRQNVGEGEHTISRELHADQCLERSVDFDEEPGPVLFSRSEPSRAPMDPVERAIATARERFGTLPGPREALHETPCWKRAQKDKERENRQVELDRLLQLRESFEMQLQECVECFVDLLPASGRLGDLRARLTGTLRRLEQLPEDPSAWQTKELENELQNTCEDLQVMIEEAISVGDQVHPISAAMMHSVRFSELRTLLSQVLQSEQDMRAALKLQRSRVPPLRRNEGGESLNNSPTCSPGGGYQIFSEDSSPCDASSRCLRGQSAPCGNIDDFSESGMASRSRGGFSSTDEDSMQLPPRFFAQTTPLLGGRQPKKDAQKKVDFGFRPDGAGEDSLENWSLFKVSKASTAASGYSDSVSTGLGLTGSSGFIGDKMRKTETKVRRHRADADCEFHEYMSQTRQYSEADWRTSSTPSLHSKEKRKRLPHLPKLVNASSAGRTLLASNSAVDFRAKGDDVASWERSPPPVKLRVSIPTFSTPTKKFRAT